MEKPFRSRKLFNITLATIKMSSITEKENPKTSRIDEVSTTDAIRLINNEDKIVANAVENTLENIAQTIENIADKLEAGGKLFYIGTGTSGRLGVLDASELPPTFGVSSELVQGVIAGGYDALYKAVEASEDDEDAGRRDLQARGITDKDAVIGIAASGSTPYTIGAVEYAKSLGCFTSCVTCNPESPITKVVDVPIVAEVGPEVISGSTRMKSGTAQKMILNMISTVTMIRLGFVKGNKMTNLNPKNAKLIERSLRILIEETGLSEKEATSLFSSAKNDLKTALVMQAASASYDVATQALQDTNLVIDAAIKKLRATN